MATSVQCEGILKEFKPSVNQNGEHKTWTSAQGRKYWSFLATFETMNNGQTVIDTGELSSNSDSPKWEIGTKYHYDRTETVLTDGRELIRFSGMKKTDISKSVAGAGKGIKSNLSAEDRERIIRSVALEVAHNAIIDLQITDKVESFTLVENTANLIASFITKHSEGVKEKEMMLENSVRRSIDGIQFRKYLVGGKDKDGNPIRGITTSAQLLEYAYKCFAYIWTGQSLTPDQLKVFESMDTKEKKVEYLKSLKTAA